MSKKSRIRKLQDNRTPLSPVGKISLIPSSPAKLWQITAVCAVLALITAIAYSGVRNNDFVNFDDHGYVLENSHVQQGVTAQSLAWAFTTYDQSNWHPVTWISHMLDWNLYGSNPLGHHLTNVFFHAANAILLFLLLIYMTGLLGRSAMVAFLFALHPAHVESVAWLSERKDVLCAFFYLAALLAYAWHVRKPSVQRFVCIVCLYACALLSKPMAVSLPFALLLLDYWPLRRITFNMETREQWLPSLSKLCLEKWLLFIMAAISSYMTISAQRAGTAMAPLKDISLWNRFGNAAISYCHYVRIMIWPNPLRAFYYHASNSIKNLAAISSLIALALVTIVCWRIRNQKPYCLAGWLFFLGTLVPVIGLVQVGEQAMAERYTYLPFIGLFIALVWLAGDAVAKFPQTKVAALLLAGAVIVACVVRTDAQVKVWKNTESLFSHVIEVDPRGELPNLNLGAEYIRQGRNAEAQFYLERTLDYYSSEPLALSFTAYCMMIPCDPHQQRNLPLAGQRLQQALHAAPDDPQALSNMALWFSLMGRPKDEETYSIKAIAAHPEFIQAHYYLAEALEAQGKLDQAIHEYRNLLAIKPDEASAHSDIARIMAEAHRIPEAAEELTQAVRLDPANPNTHNNLGGILFQMGEYERAAEQFSDALRIDPSNASARQNLTLAQVRMKTTK
ncbi:MAG: tetratricopeptide repeat protein [Terracidiphilus sp.]